MLKQDADKPLERAEDRTMDHHRTLLDAGAGGEAQVEALGHVEIKLDSGKLPFTLERVGDISFDLRPVKSTFAGVQFVGEAGAVHRRAEHRFGAPPALFAAKMLVRHRGQLELDLVEPQSSIDVADHLQVTIDFVLDLVRRAK